MSDRLKWQRRQRIADAVLAVLVVVNLVLWPLWIAGALPS